MNFSNSYVKLNKAFYEEIRPATVRAPRLLLWNSRLAKQFMIPKELEQDRAALAQFFSGNRILPGSEPIALAYAGHQFGHFVPQLGDGRAHLLGEVFDQAGKKFDIQLKGSGPTRFSRGGDGRCAVGPAVREFIMSEAMNALGVPTSRCLAVVSTGESVFRDAELPGAVVTRIALSHIRVGTFQFFAARADHESLKALSDFTIKRHFPDLREDGPDKYIGFLDKVIEKQIQLVVEWLRVGFIHGVMNTDNTALSGETIDYGPCAMMGSYDPQTVYSSIDAMGRYAFGNQPEIAHWNITRFAECLLPLINADTKKAIAQVEPLISGFPERFNQVYNDKMGKKLGLTSFQQEDQKLLISVLNRLKERNMDYTVSFNLLTKSLMSEVSASQAKNEFADCYDLWQKRLSEQPENFQEVHDLMRQHNPVVIPRNHHVEAVIQDCQQNGKVALAENFLKVLRSPYKELAATSEFQDPPVDGDKDYQTFCGT